MLISLKSCYPLLLAGLLTAAASAQAPTPAQTPAAPQSATSAPSATIPPKQTPQQEAWQILRSGVRSDNSNDRASAVGVLALLTHQSVAVTLARHALSDDKPMVRTAAALSLGELHATVAIPQLKTALDDKDVTVVLAAAHSLLQLKDNAGYDVYFAILTGQRKSGNGLIADQLATLKDPKKMALLGFQEGIGFIPFAGMGFTAIKTIMKDDSSPVRAAAAKVLGQDPDPDTANALADAAANDKSDLVRVAALEAIARRGDPAFIDKIVSAMFDAKAAVKFTAAAAVLRLSTIQDRRVAAARKKK